MTQTFKSPKEVRDFKKKTIDIYEKIDNGKKFISHYKEYDIFNMSKHLEIGQHFLYEKYLYKRSKGNSSLICYPEMGVFLNTIPIDQTFELEWYDYRRTWEYNISVTNDDSDMLMCDFPSEISTLVLWQDSLFVYDVWDKKPDWKQMRKAYDKTWWFHKTKEKIRHLKINSILR
jgi:hypothetical protein